jgi:ASTRA-associated protein 1
VDIYDLPSQKRQHTVHLASKSAKNGMLMALALFWHLESLILVAGYENGISIAARLRRSGSWDVIYKTQAHTQPVLSLDVASSKEYFLTSGADAIIAKHPIPSISSSTSKSSQMPQPTTTATDQFPKVTAGSPTITSANAESQTQPAKPPRKSVVTVETLPMKTVNTKHSGQQSLRIRSDSKIFATAGWDSKVRVYSAKTMSEIAVLKWHDEGCYATAFATLNVGTKDITIGHQLAEGAGEGAVDLEGEQSTAMALRSRLSELSVRDRRVKQAKEAHWLAAGSKDGKISLWDMY